MIGYSVQTYFDWLCSARNNLQKITSSTIHCFFYQFTIIFSNHKKKIKKQFGLFHSSFFDKYLLNLKTEIENKNFVFFFFKEKFLKKDKSSKYELFG